MHSQIDSFARLAQATLARRTTIRVARRYAASVHQAFAAWIDPGIARRWLFATASRPVAVAEIDAVEGGTFRFVERVHEAIVEHVGRYLEIVPPGRLAFSLSLEGSPRIVTRVGVDIEATASGSRLALTHEGVPVDSASFHRTRWLGMLYGLGETLQRAQSATAGLAAGR